MGIRTQLQSTSGMQRGGYYFMMVHHHYAGGWRCRRSATMQCCNSMAGVLLSHTPLEAHWLCMHALWWVSAFILKEQHTHTRHTARVTTSPPFMSEYSYSDNAEIVTSRVSGGWFRPSPSGFGFRQYPRHASHATHNSQSAYTIEVDNACFRDNACHKHLSHIISTIRIHRTHRSYSNDHRISTFSFEIFIICSWTMFKTVKFYFNIYF